MFETLSDSSSRTDGQDSFSTSSARAAMKKQQLKELNNELMKENALLRSQFEEAVEITAQLQELHQKNQKLVAQVSSIQAEKEDLDHRLEISLATNRELTRKLNEEKRNHSQQNDTNINAMNNEIDKIREQAKAQLDSVLAELEKVKSVHEKDVLQQKTIVGRIDRVLQSGERFFNTKLSTVDELISFFERPVQQQVEAPQAAPAQLAQPQANAELEKRIKRYKNKLRNAQHDQAALQADLVKAQSDNYELTCDFKAKIADLQNKLSSYDDERQRIISQKDSQLAALQAQIEQLHSQVAQAKAQAEAQLLYPKSQTQYAAPQSATQGNTIPKPTKKQSNHDEIEKIGQLQQQVDILNEKLAAAQSKQEDTDHKLADTEQHNAQLKLQLEKARTEVSTLHTLKDSANKEIESLRAALHAKKAAQEPVQQPRPAPNVVKYQRVIEEQKNKILALNQAADKQRKVFEKQSHDLAQLNERLEEANAQTRKVAEDFQEYRQKVESKKPITIEDVLPADAFRCPEFDGPLSACVQKIANNPSLQPVTKLQSTFKAIQAHFGAQLRDLQRSLDETTKENQFLSNSFNKFIIDLSIAVTDQPTTIEDFFKANDGQKLLEQVAEFRVKFDDMKHQTDRLGEIVQRLGESGFGSAQDPVGQINEMKNQFALQSECLASKTSKLKKLRREYRDICQAHEALKTESAQRIDLLTQKVNKFTSQLSQCESQNNQLKSENNKLHNELLDATRRLNSTEEDYKKRESAAIAKVVLEHTEKINALTQKFNELSATYNDLVEDFNAQEEDVKKLEETVENLKRTLAARERENAELKRTIVANEAAAEERLETEKKQISDTYKGAIAELTEQCNKHRADVEKMAKEVADNEKQMAIIKNDCCLLKKQKIKIENEMKQLTAKVDRERKLMETNFTAKRIQYETEMTRKLTEDHQKYEQDKRRICGFAAEAFKLFFNANSTIDEKSYRNVIEQARDELTKLTKSDASVRRIVAARDNQTTEDAVAQVIMTSA
ncbi:hypothetical protein TRFO_04491 [Tritrichomonas foetus]|uniref:Uncharacterized protein n=1 Tax=Tritrichomonas foetus TaxID=1144522 RepID=A0A1J4KIC7_9EUKA|nr:hypothetical protein [Tritrichomonas foetus]OHT09438.1 hypothetical protein TRFO_04491 [Tritrichomonas foetus]|eukprot:OHT09438.1 hypothetical protein TRFO_04491 [Tritrichomonas foetus]